MKNHITLKQKIVEILAYVLMWASIVIGIIWSAKLPKEVATHFDAAGNADGYGSSVFFLIFTNYYADFLWHQQSGFTFYATRSVEHASESKTGTCGACVQRRCLDDGGDGILFWCIYAL